MKLNRDLTADLEALHTDLEEANICYAAIGGVALYPHNIIRATEDIDILVAWRDVDKLQGLIGLGYLKRPGSSQNLWMMLPGHKVKVDILIEGQDGMPNPANIRVKINGIWYATKEALIAMKRKAGRPQDLVDIERLESDDAA